MYRRTDQFFAVYPLHPYLEDLAGKVSAFHGKGVVVFGVAGEDAVLLGFKENAVGVPYLFGQNFCGNGAAQG